MGCTILLPRINYYFRKTICGAEGIEIELFSAGFGKNQQKSILK